MGIQARLVRRLPQWVRVAPLDVMFSVLGFFSSVVSLVGVAEPNSLTRVMPWWGPMLWSICLLLGCGAWIAGLSSIKENNGHLVLTRMPALIFGLYLVSLASLAYALVLIVFAGWNGAIVSISFFAVAGGTYLRRVDFASRFRGDDL